jgi:serine/threonine protein phosphatase 1
MTYVMSDVHGNYQKFKAMLSEISFKEEDVLYLLGNLVDFGTESMELIEDISMRLNVYPIVGDRDLLAARMLHGFEKMRKSGATPDAGYISEMTAWVADGGQATLAAFRELDDDSREGVLEYFEDMTLYEGLRVRGKDYILVHAGIAGYKAGTELEDYEPSAFLTEAPDMTRPTVKGKILVVGHTPTESGTIEYGEGSIFINCGVKDGGALACLCLENGEEYYV